VQPFTRTEVRKATGTQRPGAAHGCKPVEIIPGLWNAAFDDVDTPEKLNAVTGGKVTLVVNTATAQCPVINYGSLVKVLPIDYFNDDPDAKKKVDAMPDGPEKMAALAALPPFSPNELPGDATKNIARVNAAIDQARAAGGAALVHCKGSMSRSVVFVLAYIMKEHKCSVAEAVNIMKSKWEATWPNDSFVQLLQYEKQILA